MRNLVFFFKTFKSGVQLVRQEMSGITVVRAVNFDMQRLGTSEGKT